MVFCGNCGTDIGESKFCPQCGTKAPEKEKTATQMEETNSMHTEDNVSSLKKKQRFISGKLSKKLGKSRTVDKFMSTITSIPDIDNLKSEKSKEKYYNYYKKLEPSFAEVYNTIDDAFLRVIFILEREKLAFGNDAVTIVISTIYTPTKDMTFEEGVAFYQDLLSKTANELAIERQKPDFSERDYYHIKFKESKIENFANFGLPSPFR